MAGRIAAGSVEATPGTAGSSRSILVIAAIVIGLVVLAVIVVLVASRPPATYPAGSPEATIQGYLAAGEQGDPETAYAFFSRSVRNAMTIDAYRRAWADHAWEREQERRVVLEETELHDDARATIHLRIDVFSGGDLFGSSRYTYERSIGLVRENGSWRIDEPLVGLEPIGYY